MTMTLIEFVDAMFLEDEEPKIDAHTALTGVLALGRSLIQREIATNEGIAASFNTWVERFGEPTEAKIRETVQSMGQAALKPIPVSYIKEVMEAD